MYGSRLLGGMRCLGWRMHCIHQGKLFRWQPLIAVWLQGAWAAAAWEQVSVLGIQVPLISSSEEEAAAVAFPSSSQSGAAAGIGLGLR